MSADVGALRSLAAGLSRMEFQPPRETGGAVVSVADFGALPDGPGCSRASFAAALDHCRAVGARRLSVPAGVYRFDTAPPAGGALLSLQDLEDFTFDGGGAELVFSRTEGFVSIKNCRRVEVRNLVLDWDWDRAPLASLGEVVQVSEDGRFFDCRFPDRRFDGETIDLRMVGPFHPREFKPGLAGAFEFRPYRNPHLVTGENGETDGKMAELVRELSNVLAGTEILGPSLLRFTLVDPVWARTHLKAGQVYRFRHFEYDTVGVDLSDSRDLLLEDLCLYSCPGTGFRGQGLLSDFRFRRCRIVLRPGTTRPVTTTADCLHIASSLGRFVIEDCEFSYAGDDCINLHDNTSMGVLPAGDRSLRLLRIQAGRNPIGPGDRLEFRRGDFSPAGFSSAVRSAVFRAEDSTCLVELEDRVPPDLGETTIVFNRRYHTEDYVIRNNFFHSNRARGLLIHGSRGLVEGNRFWKIQGPAIQIESGAESRWAEGTGVSKVLFRKNTIESCDLNRWMMAVVYMGVYLPGGRTSFPVFEDIVFEENTVVDCPRQAWFLSSCRNVVLQNNAVVNPNQEPYEGRVYGSSQAELPLYGETYGGTIQVVRARDVRIEGNRLVSYAPTRGQGIFLDPGTSTGIWIGDNPGFGT